MDFILISILYTNNIFSAILKKIMTTRQTGGLLAPIRGSYRPASKGAGFHFVQALMPLTRSYP